MLNTFAYTHEKKNLHQNTPFFHDTLMWFKKKNDGHMGKWQYCDPKYDGDSAKGSILWEKWVKSPSSYYMLRSQACLIQKYAKAILNLTGPIDILIDLGPGEKEAVHSNTIPFVNNLTHSLKAYIPVDLCKSYVDDAKKIVRKAAPKAIGFPHTHDFLNNIINYPKSPHTLALCFGGIIGNYAGTQRTQDFLPKLIGELEDIKRNLPLGGYIIIGLDANQDAFSLIDSYDHPFQAEFEINIMHRIKRDLFMHERGYNPNYWEYRVKWHANSFQICHLAHATKDQNFWMGNDYINIRAGEEFVIDNSFKFPVGIFQQAAIHAGYEPLASYLDDEKRMALHLLRVTD